MAVVSDRAAAHPARGARPLRVGLRADASAAVGGGHMMRCLALAEELRRQGAEAVLLGSVDGLDWLREQLAERRLELLPGPSDPAGLVEAARAAALDAVVLDSYALAAECSAALRSAGLPVAVIVDGTTRGQSADLVIDQAVGSPDMSSVLPETTGGAGEAGGERPRRLGGFEHALVRGAVLAARDGAGSGSGSGPGAVPHVLCFFGATDPYGAAPDAVAALLATGLPVRLTVVAAGAGPRGAVEALAVGPGQVVRVTPPVADLPGLAREADAVVTAAGSSVLDLLCLGRAVAVLVVAEAQWPVYRAVVDAGLVVGLGALESLRGAGSARVRAVAALRELLADGSARAGLARRGAAAVDGSGCVRVAGALLGLARSGREQAG
ncbi:hypothetical protein [Kitasatospora phosalacinea]|uniref:UDP-2,4-diacetamido-2,4, 6-trideoxy-beta-L-altropyranose hydrolase n=1 Tax=Kitasatospora phosalacinea TaxID=2065 RepID=A0A9W6UM38_9ACTN|nr:hypothetical protein [Kitasatospora phosalacinea]GLW55046.1 UDP-2,4-diacetamido-2,4,6-trideoxy-beta-L-altropyranose hydrolase [Kitasatospora phosalacinea]